MMMYRVPATCCCTSRRCMEAPRSDIQTTPCFASESHPYAIDLVMLRMLRHHVSRSRKLPIIPAPLSFHPTRYNEPRQHATLRTRTNFHDQPVFIKYVSRPHTHFAPTQHVTVRRAGTLLRCNVQTSGELERQEGPSPPGADTVSYVLVTFALPRCCTR
uniref:Uncharacterized protein n=1 Tax=Psilocybe cubensis TaxID=181762 RepID=A0A8H7XVJ5_PSICU